MIDFGKLLNLQGTIVWLPCTIVLYAGSSALCRRLGKAPAANPTLLSVAALVVILALLGVPYKAYFESVAILHYLLGTAVVALALPLYRNANRLHGRYLSMALALVAGSLASIVVSGTVFSVQLGS
jgi:putative effector of murein hydrolase